MKLEEFITKINNRFWGAVEYYLSINWFNPFMTFYVNLRSLPFKQALRFPIYVYGNPRFYSLKGKASIIGRVETGMVKFNITYPGSPSNMTHDSEMTNDGLIVFNGKCVIRTGNRIVVGSDAELNFGKGIIIGDKINIGCFNKIKIGDRTRIAHRSQIFDTNYHYILNLKNRKVKSILKSITIGNDCWICNSSMISSSLPAGTIVASNSLVNSYIEGIEDNCLIGGAPAKIIAKGYRLINNPIIERLVTQELRNSDFDYITLEDNYEL